MRSAVNCTREKRRPSETARACASVVFPTPGTSSIRRWPPARRQATQSSIWGRLPTMIVLIWLTSSDSWAARGRLIDPTLLEKPRAQRPMTTAFYTHPDCRGHDMGRGHPECPERLDALGDYMIASSLQTALDCREAPIVDDADLGNAHSSGYVAELREVLERVTHDLHLPPPH